MKTVQRVLIFVLTAAILLSATSCVDKFGFEKDVKAYDSMLKSLFEALDSNDAEALYALFSPEAQKRDKDMREQIAAMLEVYEGPTQKIGWDRLCGGGDILENGRVHKTAGASFAVKAGNGYYWFSIDLVYENTFDENGLGITRLEFFTADEACIFEYSESLYYSENYGLHLHIEDTLECEVRAVDGKPLKYTPTDSPIDLEQAKKALESSTALSDFYKTFGEPNAELIWKYYELKSENGEPRYLRLYDDESDIYELWIVDDFGEIESVYSNGPF